MPRSRLAALLLVPLFVLPLIAAGALAAWARGAHRDAVARARDAGASAWLARRPELAASALALFQDADRAGPHAIPAAIDGRQLLVDPGVESPLGNKPWVFTRRYPRALLPDALARDRIAVETGRVRRPAEAQLFARLREQLDRDLLRTAALPAGTKLYLARRGGWTEALPFLQAVRALPAEFSAPESARGRPGAISVLADPGALPVLHLQPRAALPVASSADGRFRLVFGERPGALWTGRLATPLAGTWSVESLHKERWWAVSSVRRWAGPALAGFLAYLVLPIALAFELRRRRRAADARARLLNELAHDLRTPLASVRLHAELLASGRVPDERRNGSVDVVARESARLSSLLANLLDLSRLERGTRLFEVDDVDIAVLVAHAVQDFLAVHPARQADVDVNVPEQTRVRADRTALARVLANLLDNAGKFTAPGTAIRISWTGAEIVVEDEGPGVAPADRPALFRAYARGDAAVAAAVPGTGMGLALVRDLMHGMGGSVRFEPAARFVIGFAQ